MSFVVFGVGSEVPGGVADILQGRAPASGPSVEGARERAQENPRDAQAWRDLATAYQREGDADGAIAALGQLVSITPRDEGVRRELAGLQLSRAAQLRSELQELQARARFISPGDPFLPDPSSPLGQAFAERPVTSALESRINEQLNGVYSRLIGAYEEAKLQYVELANLDPQDASVQLQLADAALNSGDTASALAAYKRFLELAPDDPSAQLVKRQVEELEASASAAPDG